jgi:hypothetical protein
MQKLKAQFLNILNSRSRHYEKNSEPCLMVAFINQCDDTRKNLGNTRNSLDMVAHLVTSFTVHALSTSETVLMKKDSIHLSSVHSTV